MRVHSVVLVTILTAAGTAKATTWYVNASTGRDTNSGRTTTSPFATLQHAESATAPGDTVSVMTGTYSVSTTGSNILLINRSGSAAAPITYEAGANQHPVLSFANAWAAINIEANWINVEGFTIVGNAASITSSYGQSQARALGNPLTNGDGIDISPGASPFHNIAILDNVIHDVPGNGIETQNADYVSVIGNTIYNTAHWSPYGDSAISLYEMRDIDAVTGYKNYVVGNVVYANSEYYPCACTGYKSISDGNGIIIDDNRNTQSDNVAYHGRTLVALNVSYDNGGSGIHAYESQHVDIVDNTAYLNNTTASINEGQIFARSGSDVTMIDNILVAPAGKSVTTGIGNSATVVESGNLLWSNDGKPVLPATLGTGDLVGNPLFVGAAAGNFSLTAGSPAIGSAKPLAVALGKVAPLQPATLSAHKDRGAF